MGIVCPEINKKHKLCLNFYSFIAALAKKITFAYQKVIMPFKEYP